jgi:hypothetical protein
MDKGPWTLLYGALPDERLVGVISEDFKHDVALKVSGDFEDEAQMEAYCHWLLTVLNRPADPTADNS